MSLIPLINILVAFIAALLSMAFFTLLERKILSYSQLRKGPNKVSVLGLPQPLADALKLLSKETNKPIYSNIFPFFMSPVLTLLLALLFWSLYPSPFPLSFFSFSILFILCISSFNVYTSLMAGWASNSKYSLLGALRNIAQTISYEVSMALTLLSLLVLFNSFDLNYMATNSNSLYLIILPLTLLIWFVSVLAETNRTPFDLAEGESELVSGFNTEFSGGLFTLIFMAEYMNIIFMSMLTAIFFFPPLAFKPLMVMFLAAKTSLIAGIILWIRASLPRLRFDQLMYLMWTSFLPATLAIFIMTFTLRMI